MGWSDSSSKSDPDIDVMEEEFQGEIIYTARRGPIVEMNPHDITATRNLWSSCLVGFLLDDRSFSPRRLQTILSAAWELQGRVQILGKDGKFYVLHFDNDEDCEYVCANSPWAIQGALLSIFHWRPNL